MKKVLLLDIENLHKSEKELLKYLSEYQFVYLVYAKSPINLSLDGLQMLSDFVSKKKLVLIKMPKIYKTLKKEVQICEMYIKVEVYLNYLYLKERKLYLASHLQLCL